MKKSALAVTLASALALPCAWAQDDRVSVDGELSVGRDVVPPDIVDTSPEQDRIRSGVFGEVGVNYDAGPAILRASAGARVFPSESDYDRYPLEISARFDLPVTADGRTRLRLIPSYEYVFGKDGHVFDRPRLDGQFIHRHNPEHTTTVRLRYGYRNQSERRFRGYDQSEWLGEIRHLWRPNRGPTRITASLLALYANAEANRFSYSGYGALLGVRRDLREDLQAYGRLYLVHRDYKAPFSRLYPYDRDDTQARLTAGLEKKLTQRLSLFGEAGYARNNSNVPTRRYDGFVGRVGVILR